MRMRRASSLIGPLAQFRKFRIRLSCHKVSFCRKLPIERLVNLWRDPSTKDDGAASELLKPFDARLMRCSPVSTRINHVANDDEECSRPVEPVETQNTLF